MKLIVSLCLLACASLGFGIDTSRCTTAQFTGTITAGSIPLSTVTLTLSFSSPRPYYSVFRIEYIEGPFSFTIGGNTYNQVGQGGTLDNGGYTVTAIYGGSLYNISNFNVYRGQVYPSSGVSLSLSNPTVSSPYPITCLRWERIAYTPDYQTCSQLQATTTAANSSDIVVSLRTLINVGSQALNITLQSKEEAVQYYPTTINYFRNNINIGAVSAYGSASYDTSNTIINYLLIEYQGFIQQDLPLGYFEIRGGNVITFNGQQFTGANKCATTITPPSALIHSSANVTSVITELCCVQYRYIPTTFPEDMVDAFEGKSFISKY